MISKAKILLLVLSLLSLGTTACGAATTVSLDDVDLHYQGYNDLVSVPSDMAYLSTMPKDDHDYRSKTHKQDVVMRRAHGTLNRICVSGTQAKVLAGSRMLIEFEDQLDSRSAKTGDQVQGKMSRDWYAYNILISPKGATVFGKVIERIEPDPKQKGAEATIKLVFDKFEGINRQKLDFCAIPATGTDIERGPEHARAYRITENGYVTRSPDGIPYNGGTFGFTLGLVADEGIASVILLPGDRVVLELQKDLPVVEQSIAAEPVFINP